MSVCGVVPGRRNNVRPGNPGNFGIPGNFGRGRGSGQRPFNRGSLGFRQFGPGQGLGQGQGGFPFQGQGRFPGFPRRPRQQNRVCIRITQKRDEKCIPNKLECIGHLECKRERRGSGGSKFRSTGSKNTRKGSDRDVQFEKKLFEVGRFKRSPQRKRRKPKSRPNRKRRRPNRKKQSKAGFTCQVPRPYVGSKIECEINTMCPCGEYCEPQSLECRTANCRNNFDCQQYPGMSNGRFSCLNGKVCAVDLREFWKEVCPAVNPKCNNW